MADLSLTEDGAIAISGEIDFFNAPRLKQEGEGLLRKHANESVEIDFSAVTAAGSAAVSLVLCWLRLAEAQGKTLVFKHLPEDLVGVAQVSGLTPILGISQNGTNSI